MKRLLIFNAIYIVVCIGLTIYFATRGPDAPTETHYAVQSIRSRMYSITLKDLVEAYEQPENPEHISKLLDAYVANHSFTGEPPEELHELLNYPNTKRSKYQYEDIAKKILTKHYQQAVPLIMRRFRELADEATTFNMGNRIVWNQEEYRFMNKYFELLLHVLRGNNVYQFDPKTRYNDINLRMSGGYIRKGFMSGSRSSSSRSFPMVPHYLVGEPVVNAPKSIKNSDKSVQYQLRQVEITKNNYSRILRSITKVYEKHLKSGDTKKP